MALLKKGKIAALLPLLVFICLLFPAARANAIACNFGQSHLFNSNGDCTLCNASAAAALGSTYYGSAEEALAAAGIGDTVTLFSGIASDVHCTIAEGVTLDCGEHAIFADVTNYGSILGGRFTGTVENYGDIEGATLSGTLICHTFSAVLGCHLGGMAHLYGGSIEGGEIASLSIRLFPIDIPHTIHLDLRTAELANAHLTLTNESTSPLTADFLLLPEGYALLRADGRYDESIFAGNYAVAKHTHTASATPAYDANTHFWFCATCYAPMPRSTSVHLYGYTDLDNGSHRAACTVCDFAFEEAHIGGEATCLAPATCTLCHATYGDKAPHRFVNYYEDGNATCESNGTKTATCENCTVQKTVTIPDSRLPHRDADHDERCDTCPLVLTAPTTTAPVATTAAPIVTVAPTTTEAPTTTTAQAITAVPTTTPKPATTTIPTTAQATTTRAPATTKAPSTTKVPTTTTTQAVSTTTAITTTAENPKQPTTVLSKLSWWHFAIIGLLLGGIAAFSLRRMD